MPFRRNRRSVFRRRRRGRTAWYNRKYSTAQIARAAWRATKYIKGLVNSEMFHHDKGADAQAVPSTGSITHITDIAVGDDAGSRTGNSILLRNMLKRIRFTKHASATTTFIRYMIVQDTQQVGDTTPAITDVLEYADVDSPMKLGSSGRFKVMLNRMVALDTNRLTFHKETFSKLYSHIRYNGNASTDIQKNGIYLILISDQLTNTPSVDWYFRLGYHDN